MFGKVPEYGQKSFLGNPTQNDQRGLSRFDKIAGWSNWRRLCTLCPEWESTKDHGYKKTVKTRQRL